MCEVARTDAEVAAAERTAVENQLSLVSPGEGMKFRVKLFSFTLFCALTWLLGNLLDLCFVTCNVNRVPFVFPLPRCF